MIKLTYANFLRLKKDNIFWSGIIFMFLFVVYNFTMRYIDVKNQGYTQYVDDRTLWYAMFIGILSAIFCSLYIGTEYSDGTIRNKLIIGNTRFSIYLSNLFICSIASLLMCLSFIIAVCLIGIPYFGFFVNLNTIILYILCSIALTIAFCSIYTLIAMINHNKAAVSIICILGIFILMFATTYISSQLREPEIYDPAVYYDEQGEIEQYPATPNPNYVDGTKRRVYEFLYDFIPTGQAQQLSSLTADDLLKLAYYDILIIIVTTGFGLYFFNKKDIK